MSGFKEGSVQLRKKDVGNPADPNHLKILVDTNNNLYTIDEFGVYRPVGGGYDIQVSGTSLTLITSASTKIISLNDTGVISGTYGSQTIIPAFKVGNDGRIISVSSMPISATGLGTVTSIGINSTTLSISSSPVTTSGNIVVNLSVIGTSGIFTKIVKDIYGRVTSGGYIGVSDILDRSFDGTLSANSDDKIPTEKAIKTYIDENDKRLSVGIIDTVCYDIIDNGDGTANVLPQNVYLYDNPNFQGNLYKFYVTGTTLSFTDGIEQHICVKYNGGSPVFYVENNMSNINESDITCTHIIWRQGTTLHSMGRDSKGVGLSNKIARSILMTKPYSTSIDERFILSESLSPSAKTILVTSAVIFAGVVPISVLAFNSSIDKLTFSYHNSGNWSYTSARTYQTSSYDDGNNLITATNNRYIVNWFYRSIGDVKEVFYVVGNNQYNKIADAELEVPRNDLPIVIRRHCVLIGRIISEVGSSSGIVENVTDINFTNTTIPNHNDLNNIQGGSTGSYYHVSATTFGYLSGVSADIQNQLNSKLTSTLISAYVLNTTVSAISGNLQSQITNISANYTSRNEVSAVSGNLQIQITNNNNKLSGYLPLSGGSLTGQLKGTTISASGNISANDFVDINFSGSKVLVSNFNIISESNLPSSALNYLSGVSADIQNQLNNTANKDIYNITKEPTGFPRIDNTKLLFNNSTRYFTLSAISGNYDVYYRGYKFTKTTETIQIPNLSGLHFIYFTSAGTLTTSQIPWDIPTTIQVSMLYWTGVSALNLCEERHGCVMDCATHEYLHKTKKTQYVDGFTATYTLSNDTSAKFGVIEGNIADEDLNLNIKNGIVGNYLTQPINFPGYFPVYYREGVDGNGNWRKDVASDYPYKGTSGNFANYNKLTTGVWGQQPLTNGNYGAYFIFATNDTLEPIISVQSQRDDTTLDLAKTNNLPDTLSFADFPVAESKLLYRIIVRAGSSYTGNPYKIRIEDVSDYRNANITINSTGNVGTVTYVALSANPILTIAGTPITNVGTFTIDFAPETSSTFLRGPISGNPNIPTFGPILSSDLPMLSAYTLNTVTSTISGNLQSQINNTNNSLSAFLPLSGGTLTGQLKGTTISASGNISATNFVGNLTGYKNIDNTNEITIANGYSSTGVVWFNYRGATSAITEYRLGSGKSDGSYASIRANSYIVSGGSSNQFLKGDGSLDSTSYTSQSTVSAISGNLQNQITINNNSLSGYLPLSGGTLTGQLTSQFISAVGGITINRNSQNILELYRPTSANTFSFGIVNKGKNSFDQIVDYSKILNVIQSSVSGLHSGYIKIDQYKNGVEQTILETSNDKLTVYGTVSANAFIGNSFSKIGGTSSQFLKADGSIDSNAYQTISAFSQSISGYLPLSGGILTGNLSGTIISASQFNGILNGSKNVENSNETTISNNYSSNSGKLYINYRGATSAISQYYICNGLGSGTYSFIMAAGYKVSGGTIDQFLKADGSLDSNTYQTTSAFYQSISGYLPLSGGTLTGQLNAKYISADGGFLVRLNSPDILQIYRPTSSVTTTFGQTFEANNNLGQKVVYSRILNSIDGAVSGLHSGSIYFKIYKNGVEQTPIQILDNQLKVFGTISASGNITTPQVNGNLNGYKNVDNSNECTIANTYANNSGLLYVNYRGATSSINEYRFCNGLGSIYSGILASAFIKNGGTSSQFLKADGSIEQNSFTNYLPLSGGTMTGNINGGIISATNLYVTGFTGSKVLVSNTTKEIIEATTSTTEVNYLVGVSANVQTQINALKQNSLSGIGFGTVNRITKFITTSSVGDSSVTDTGSNVIFSTTVSSTGNMTAPQFIGNLNGYKNVDNSNECTIANGYNSAGGLLYVNFRGSTLSINEYRFCNGLGSTYSAIRTSAFIKNGGTNTQFLKADGTVDSNTYALNSSLGNYLPLSGGTLTGNLIVKEAFVGTSAVSDTAYFGHKLKIGNYPAITQTFQGITTIDSDVDAYYNGLNLNVKGVPQLLLDGTSITSNFNLYSPAFIKSGGASDQFLMADGSISYADSLSNKFLPLSGGTLSRNLKISAVSEGWSEGIRIMAPSNSWGGMRLSRNSSTSNTEGNWAIGYANNNSDNLEIDVYTASTQLKHTIFYKNGDVYHVGNLSANSFIKLGGTSSQFLKADGTVDSNTYALNSSLGNYLPLLGGQLLGDVYNRSTFILNDFLGIDYTKVGQNYIQLRKSTGEPFISLSANTYNVSGTHLYIKNTGASDKSNVYTDNIFLENLYVSNEISADSTGVGIGNVGGIKFGDTCYLASLYNTNTINFPGSPPNGKSNVLCIKGTNTDIIGGGILFGNTYFENYIYANNQGYTPDANTFLINSKQNTIKIRQSSHDYIQMADNELILNANGTIYAQGGSLNVTTNTLDIQNSIISTRSTSLTLSATTTYNKGNYNYFENSIIDFKNTSTINVNTSSVNFLNGVGGIISRPVDCTNKSVHLGNQYYMADIGPSIFLKKSDYTYTLENRSDEFKFGVYNFIDGKETLFPLTINKQGVVSVYSLTIPPKNITTDYTIDDSSMSNNTSMVGDSFVSLDANCTLTLHSNASIGKVVYVKNNSGGSASISCNVNPGLNASASSNVQTIVTSNREFYMCMKTSSSGAGCWSVRLL